MDLNGDNIPDWETVERKMEKFPIPFTNRIIEVIKKTSIEI